MNYNTMGSKGGLPRLDKFKGLQFPDIATAKKFDRELGKQFKSIWAGPIAMVSKEKPGFVTISSIDSARAYKIMWKLAKSMGAKAITNENNQMKKSELKQLVEEVLNEANPDDVTNKAQSKYNTMSKGERALAIIDNALSDTPAKTRFEKGGLTVQTNAVTFRIDAKSIKIIK